MGTQVIRCSCKHPFQDSLYGVGNRIANEQRTGQFRCTVCGTVGGTKSTSVVKVPATVAAPAPAEKKEEKSKERKSSKFKTKEKKPSSKDTKAPKAKIEKKSGKGGKKK